MERQPVSYDAQQAYIKAMRLLRDRRALFEEGLLHALAMDRSDFREIVGRMTSDELIRLMNTDQPHKPSFLTIRLPF